MCVPSPSTHCIECSRIHSHTPTAHTLKAIYSNVSQFSFNFHKYLDVVHSQIIMRIIIICVGLVYIYCTYIPIQLKFQFSRSACSLFDMDRPCPAKRRYDYATLSLQRASIVMIIMTMAPVPPTPPINTTKRMTTPMLTIIICDRTM